MKRRKVAVSAAVAVALLALAGCGTKKIMTLNGVEVPTDPTAVCKLLAEESNSAASDSNTTSLDSNVSALDNASYPQFIAWAGSVKDATLSKDLRALGIAGQQADNDSASSTDTSDDASYTADMTAIANSYTAITTDCAKYGVTLPNSTGSDTPSAGSSSAAPGQAGQTPQTDQALAFGQTKTYSDGLAITVGPPVAFTPNKYAGAPKAPIHVKFKVTLTNNTSKVFDPVEFNASLQSGSTEEKEVFDIENNVGNVPDTKLLSGHTVTFWVGFGAQSTVNLVLDVTPDFNHSDALFAN